MSDNDFPVGKGFLQYYVQGMNAHQEKVEGQPGYGTRSDYAQKGGGPLLMQGQGFEIPRAQQKLTYPA